MHEHGHPGLSDIDKESAEKTVLLVGHPNVGKSVTFSNLTGKYVTVSNYPGTTVEIMTGRSARAPIYVIDSPGIGSIIPRSEDEKVAFRMLIDPRIDVVVQVGDAKNLRRVLLYTLSLAEAGKPLVLDLNMYDEAVRRGYEIDVEKLEEILGCPVVKTVAVDDEGTDRLIEKIELARPLKIDIKYDPKIEEAITRISALLPELPVSKRFVATALMSANLSFVDEILSELGAGEAARDIKKVILETQAKFSEPLGLIIMQTRADLAERIASEVIYLKEKAAITSRLKYRLGDLSLHPVFGYVVLAGVLWLLYEFVGVFAAGTLVDFFEGVIFGRYINPLAVELFSRIPSAPVRDFFIGEYGQITMGLTYAIAIVFPIVTAFFLIFSLLEDSGYLPRLAVLLNRSFAAVGLNGKAVVPIVLGLGCGTMATLVTRVLDTRRERIIATLLLALGIPCSAQLGVILGLFSALGPRALVLFFVLIAVQLVIVGWLAARVLPGKRSAFVTEIPPYRLPKLKNVGMKTYYRSRWFIKEAVPLFLIGTAILYFADITGALDVIIRAASPVIVGLLGLPAKATEAFIIGFLRRDYGAAGLFVLFEKGLMDRVQAFVSMIVITLFVPCIANFLVIIKERGAKVAAAIVSFVFIYAIAAGAVINYLLRLFQINI